MSALHWARSRQEAENQAVLARYRARQINPNAENSRHISQPPYSERPVSRLSHMDHDIWRKACIFVTIDPESIEALPENTTCIEIQGYPVKFYPHQLYAAFYLLMSENRGRHGLNLSDDTGLGKSLTTLLYTMLAVLININVQDCQDYPGEHLRKRTKTHMLAPDDQCPLQLLVTARAGPCSQSTEPETNAGSYRGPSLHSRLVKVFVVSYTTRDVSRSSVSVTAGEDKDQHSRLVVWEHRVSP